MKRVAISLIGFLALVLAPAWAQTAAPTASIRIAHLSPDAPPVDIWFNGVRVLTQITYKTVTSYITVRSGTSTIWVTPRGQVIPRVINTQITLEAGKSYTVAAVGLLANIKPQLYLDEIATPSPGNVNIRLIHASPDAPAVDVIATAPAQVTLRTGLAFPEATSYISTPAQTYTVEVRPSGTQNAVLVLPQVALVAGSVYSVFVVGTVAGNNLEAVLALDNPLTRSQ